MREVLDVSVVVWAARGDVLVCEGVAGAFVTAEGEVGDWGSGRHFSFLSFFLYGITVLGLFVFFFRLVTSMEVCVFLFWWMGEWEVERCGVVVVGGLMNWPAELVDVSVCKPQAFGGSQTRRSR